MCRFKSTDFGVNFRGNRVTASPPGYVGYAVGLAVLASVNSEAGNQKNKVFRAYWNWQNNKNKTRARTSGTRFMQRALCQLSHKRVPGKGNRPLIFQASHYQIVEKFYTSSGNAWFKSTDFGQNTDFGVIV